MRTVIRPPAFRPLPLRSLTPLGWYRDQLSIQSEGLSGHLDLFWPDIRNSKWIGGEAEGWERMPYWLDGFIPLAVLTNDGEKLARARKYIDAILAKQQPDGWLCPTQTEDAKSTYDVWALFLILKVLTVWADATGDDRIEGVVEAALLSLDRHIDRHTLFNWASTRWFECLIPIFWLYERRPQPWLCALCEKLKAQGFDWEGFYDNWPMEQPHEQGRWSQMNHVVNQAMMLKEPVLWNRVSGSRAGAGKARAMLEQLDKAHGMPTGMFTGDECLAGRSPSQGTELCAVAETLYSLQFLIGEGVDTFFSDRLERIAFNAWPAPFGPDMWTHQYDQQVNQMQAIRQKDPIWRTNRPDANTFGLEPDFGCCTANLSQGWPKLAQSAFYQGDSGFLLGIYLPLRAQADWQGTSVAFELVTHYPFDDTIDLYVDAQRPVTFDLLLPIPAYASKASVTLDDQALPCCAGTHLTISRIWTRHHIRLTFPMEARWLARDHEQYVLQRGPLIYSLRIGERWEQYNQDVPGHELPHGDFEVFPTTPWNIMLHARKDASDVEFTCHAPGSHPFSAEGAPVTAHLTGYEIEWPIEHDSASAVHGHTILSEEKPVEMIPYGCTCLRMTQLPVLFKEMKA